MYLLLNNHEVGVYYLPIKSGWIFHIAVLLGFRGWHIQKSLKCLDLTIFSPGSVRWRGRRRRGGGSRHQRGESGEEFFSGKGVGCFNLINRLTVFVYTIYISTSSIIPIENAYVWVYRSFYDYCTSKLSRERMPQFEHIWNLKSINQPHSPFIYQSHPGTHQPQQYG